MKEFGLFSLGIACGVFWFVLHLYGFWWALAYGFFWHGWIGYRLAEWLLR